LRVYGSGPLENELKSLANNKVRFMGFCNNIVGELYADVDVVAVVTIIQEANSLSVLEAKSVGLPVIVTNIGGQAELVEDGKDGILVPIKDAKAIANAINSIYRDKDKYLDMANASFASVEKYDLKRYKDRIVKLFLSEANS
jgi:glycosyltransferase involved in cell wall biosynthesis